MTTSLSARFAVLTLITVPALCGCLPWRAAEQAPQLPEVPASDDVWISDGTRTLASAHGRELLVDAVGPANETRMAQVAVLVQRITQLPLVAGNAARLLVDGPETHGAMYDAIDAARHHVHLETYILTDDAVGNRLARALIAAQRRGVEVRVIYDAVGSIETGSGFFTHMRENGVQVRPFNPVDPREDVRVWRVNNRDHRKLLIVDNRTVFVGGVNFASVYASSSATAPGEEDGLEQGWRDTHLQLSGPAVDQFQRLFLETWSSLGEPVADRSAYLQPAPAQGRRLVRALASQGGDRSEFQIYRGYLAAIRAARERVWLTQGYFSPNAEFLEELERAARRGVDVRLVLPGFIDVGPVFHASRANYARLLEAGVRLWEHEDALLHAKTAVVDGVWSTVGSANLDVRSFVHNDEVNAVVYGAAFGEQMEAMFLRDLTVSSEITRESWRRRPWLDRFKEFVARRFNYWW